MDYKVEMKPSYWHVILSAGMYSDYRENHLFFAGNDAEEIWNFLCRYVDSIAKPDDFLYGDVDFPLAIQWEDKKYVSSKFNGDIRDIDWSIHYGTVDVKIERLSVIYFQR